VPNPTIPTRRPYSDAYFPAAALFEDFEEVESSLIGERLRSPIVENKELDPRELSIRAALRDFGRRVVTSVHGDR